MKKKYLIPPKLQKEFLMGGLNVIEIMVGLAWLLVSVLTHHYSWLLFLGIGSVLFCRLDGEHNVAYYIALLCRYYGGTKHFTRR